MNSVPDRPYAALTPEQLAERMQQNLRDQSLAAAAGRSAAAKRVMAQLKRTVGDLIDERNARQDMQQLPF